MGKEHKGELQNGENYKTSKTIEQQNTKLQTLQNGKRQNVESYRMAKRKTSKCTEQQNTKQQKTLNAEKIGYIGLHMKTI